MLQLHEPTVTALKGRPALCSPRHTSKETTTDTDPRPANGTTPHSDRHAATQHPGRDIPSDQSSNHRPASIGATVSNHHNRHTSATPWATTSEFSATDTSLTWVTEVKWRPTSPADYLRHMGPILRNRHERRAFTGYATDWLAEFQRFMYRNLRGAGSLDTVEEVVAREAAKVWEHFDHVIRHWTPARYARHRASGARAIVDLLRNDAAQRGEGARHTRTIDSLDATVNGAYDIDALTLYDVIGADDDGYLAIETRELLTAALLGLSARQREVLYLVDAIGHPVTEVAEHLRLTRESTSRALNAARRAVRVALAS